ncbi:hypothetical protein DESAMIL20_2010 [Desulfurella amilsii]|uniref:Uncharacterized protein n=1 Tax=Desulfurella amilsii TaxID=1562698 RepID=A0A1X4XY47_9BACT|nr:hypothetical protein DESAMIL20_2010 [Desulfurella amilsii]
MVGKQGEKKCPKRDFLSTSIHYKKFFPKVKFFKKFFLINFAQ